MLFEYGQLSGSFDTTLSAGAIYRLKDPDPELYGTANGGQQNSVNADDGNLNYPKGWASQAVKATHDLELKWRNYSAFVRGTYFYDFENQDDDRARTPLSEQALDRVGRGADWLDMYVRGSFDVGGRALDLRLGRQVLSLGESTFIPNGINIVNPVDVSRLRVPGSELREALLPVNMFKASYGVTEQLTLEAYWLLEFRRTEIDPAGTYFSTNDFATRGGERVYLGFGALSDRQALGAVPRDHDREGNNYTQWGVNLRWLAAGLNDTEFGLYFANLHSRLPVISARTPTGPVTPTAVSSALVGLLIQNGAATPATAPATATGLLTLSATNPAALTAQQRALLAGAQQVALLNTAATARYFIEYPEDIKMLGASFNTSLGRSGVAWQGEVAWKQDVPLQVDDVELLFAALSSLSPTFGPPNNQIGSYLGQYGVEISGYRRKDVWTAQNTFTKVFGPTLGSSQLTLLAEVGGVYADLPSKDVLRFDGPGTFTSGSQAAMNATTTPALPATPLEAFADRFSWGYQLLGRLEYNDLFAGVNFVPSVAFVHDVSGNTPLPLGNFVEGRKSVNLVAEFNWRNAWSWEVRYVNFFGGDRFNLIHDRDYVASTIKYSF